MLKLIVRGIRANLGRLLLTLIAVTLGVSAVSGSFVLADSLRAVFGQVVEDALAGVDAQVRPIPSEIASTFGGTQDATFDEALIDDLVGMPEVGVAEGSLNVFERVYTIGTDGEVNRPQGPPVFAISWSGETEVSAFTLVEGEAPSGQQVALDEVQATAGGYVVGDTVPVSTLSGEVEDFELSALIDFGQGGTGGAYFILMDLPTVQRVTGNEGLINAIDLSAASGVETAELIAAVGADLPPELEVVSQEDLVAEGQADFGVIIDVIGGILLGFAFVILFVSIFIIYNTFVILVGQRTRMLGLLRSIGASGGQIRFMVLIEALIIGLIASLIGLFGGIGIAALLKWVFSQGGNSFPDGPLELRPRTVIVVFAVGLLVTVASALIPALRAARVAPLEAIRDETRKPRSLTFRATAGALVLAIGVFLLAFGLAGRIDSLTNTFVAMGVGGALGFIGVSMLSALFAGRVASMLGLPVQSFKGVTGRLARDNASRNPQRTSATATALMIGLALITGVAVLTSSIVRNFDEILEDTIQADLLVAQLPNFLPYSPTIQDELAALDEVETVAGYSIMEAGLSGDAALPAVGEGQEIVDVRAFDVATGDAILDFGLTDGDYDIGPDGLAVSTEAAAERGLSLGDVLSFQFEDGESDEFTVRALYDNPQAVDGVPFVFAREVAAEHLISDAVGWLAVSFVGDLDPASDEFAAARASVDEVLEAQPQLESQDNAEFREQVVDQIGQLQILIYGLLAMCIVVAFFGIVNTMVLSVLERTREIGLLRAVGTTRSQLRTSIRWEAVIVSLFGSLLGVIMGVLLGWAVVTAIPDSFLSVVAIPWIQILLFLVAGGVIGVIAAFFPGARAARLNVLDAIAYE